ncbi:MAG: carboxypeptidase-like regulatory domain-containing protein [Planctomycetaceae bacterium]|nr:carboxypeptidase-like regulatory domain-containing protein [Planctomycetaceae bacterium]
MRTIISLLFIVAIPFLSGCDTGPPRPADFPTLHRVTLTITQAGTPLEGASVTLTSKTPQAYSTASGTTNAEGVVVPRTYGFDGVPAGEYTVSVSKTAIEGGTEQMAGNALITVGGRIYQYVAADYLTAGTSPLSLDISGRKEEAIDVGASVRTFISDNVRD